mgnify:CR=1 FL=1
MSFKMRDTSSQFQPQYVEHEPVKPVEEKSSKKSKKSKKEKKTETVANPVPFTNQSSDGFQMKHDPTNQCDYF